MSRVDCENMTVTSNGNPSEEALNNYYDVFIKHLISKYGIDDLQKVFEKLESKQYLKRRNKN